jgi:membrane dipeptidase
MLTWFDAHLDLACLARCGRKLLESNPASCAEPWPPASITLPSLAAGHVRFCLATIFTEPDGTDAVGYPSMDAHAAHARGLEQLDEYRACEAGGHLARWNQADTASAPLRAGLLIEGADPILEPSQAAWWKEQGTVAVGLAWAKSSRYAGGNTTDDPITPLGKSLIAELDRLGIVHDLSHLSDVSLSQLLTFTDAPVIASHSNCRALIDTDGQRRQRHLTDDIIKVIAKRKGMIGVNIFSPFIIARGSRERRATLAEWAAHVNHICDLHGSRRYVGLGSDADGGFSAAQTPQGVNLPSNYVLLAESLAATGWSDEEVADFCCKNWLRFWGERYPQLLT